MPVYLDMYPIFDFADDTYLNTYCNLILLALLMTKFIMQCNTYYASAP